MKKIYLNLSVVREPDGFNRVEVKLDSYKYKNCFISPAGDYFGIDSASHWMGARYMGIIVLGLPDTVLKRGVYINEDWEGYLIRIGYVIIKDTAWIGGETKTEVFHRRGLTQAQKDVISEVIGKPYDENN